MCKAICPSFFKGGIKVFVAKKSYNVSFTEDEDIDWIPNSSFIGVDERIDDGSYRQDKNNVESVDILW